MLASDMISRLQILIAEQGDQKVCTNDTYNITVEYGLDEDDNPMFLIA